jgi:hypothetical protein
MQYLLRREEQDEMRQGTVFPLAPARAGNLPTVHAKIRALAHIIIF